MVVVNTGCAYMGGTRGSGILYCTEDVLEMSVMRGVKGVGGIFEMLCVWFGAWWELMGVSG